MCLKVLTPIGSSPDYPFGIPSVVLLLEQSSGCNFVHALSESRCRVTSARAALISRAATVRASEEVRLPCRLLTCTFLHAGLLHLGLNCFALYSIGPDVEAVLGYSTFAAIYLLSGLGGSVASFLFSDLVTVGASGAIFGLLGMPQLTSLLSQQQHTYQTVFLAVISHDDSVEAVSCCVAAAGTLDAPCTCILMVAGHMPGHEDSTEFPTTLTKASVSVQGLQRATSCATGRCRGPPGSWATWRSLWALTLS